ncbi:hypothetical protein DXG01_012145 [Tephrocybe rancida]|nr:hypothetical protein DXG01_012145 [Tephrocybe rancida]
MTLGGLAKDMGEEYVKETGKEAAKSAGEQTVEYVQGDEAQQKIDDAKAQAEVSLWLPSNTNVITFLPAQGMWAKLCGCFSSAA